MLSSGPTRQLLSKLEPAATIKDLSRALGIHFQDGSLTWKEGEARLFSMQVTECPHNMAAFLSHSE